MIDVRRAIEHNVQVHGKIADAYEQLHGEIFNPVEQDRLHGHLARSIGMITTVSSPRTALDIGCGTGNLTKHLIDLGFRVSAGDVTDEFLTLTERRFGASGMVRTVKLNGTDLCGIEENTFDFVAAYSVLHHIPDYLRIIEEMARVVKPGGVIYLDHEANESYWNQPADYRTFVELAHRKTIGEKLTKLVTPSSYARRIRYIFEAMRQTKLHDGTDRPEGDIHVLPKDHIEWDNITATLVSHGCEVLWKVDYLLYRRGYPETLYHAFKDKCNDMRLLAARKVVSEAH